MGKILFLSNNVPPQKNSVAFVIKNIFSKFPPDSLVIFTRFNCSKDKKLPFKYYYTSFVRAHYFTTLKDFFVECFGVIPIFLKGMNIIKKENITSILVSSDSSNFLFSAYLLSIMSKRKLNIYFFDCFSCAQSKGIKFFFNKITEKIVIKRADKIFCMSDTLKELYDSKYNVNSEIVNHPVAISEYEYIAKYKKECDSQKNIKILYTGMIYEAQIDAIKNLVEAIQDINGVELHIYSKRTEESLKKLNIIKKNVFYHGEADYEKMPQIQKNADVLFLPLAFRSPYPEIIKTASPSKMPEYLCTEVPILVHAPRNSYLARYAKKEGFALVVDEDNILKLKQSLEHLIADKKLQEELILNAKKTSKKHDVNLITKQMIGALGL